MLLVRDEVSPDLLRVRVEFQLGVGRRVVPALVVVHRSPRDASAHRALHLVIPSARPLPG